MHFSIKVQYPMSIRKAESMSNVVTFFSIKLNPLINKCNSFNSKPPRRKRLEVIYSTHQMSMQPYVKITEQIPMNMFYGLD